MAEKQERSSFTKSFERNVQQEVERNEGQIVGGMDRSQAFAAAEVGKGGLFAARDIVIQQDAPRRAIQSTNQFSLERELPPLLPYLPDRNDQEFALGRFLRHGCSNAETCPLVCIIHGDEFQSHDKFLERLCKLSIPQLLGLDKHQSSIKEYSLQWPCGCKDLGELSERLKKSLADNVLGYSFSSLEEINEVFCQYPDPVIVHTHLLTEDWLRQGVDILNEFLSFWRQWPLANTKQKLIICLFIKYQIKRPSNYPKSKNFIVRLFQHVRTYFRRQRYQRANKQIRQQLEALLSNLVNFRFQDVPTVVLPELSGVSRIQVEDWVRNETTKQFVGEAIAEQLIKGIRDIFERWEEETSSSTIPMDDLAEKLIKLLKTKTTVKGEPL